LRKTKEEMKKKSSLRQRWNCMK